jgi:AcrR family transcriptional regulator
MIKERMSREDRLVVIRQIAADVFLKKGYRFTTMEDIVQATGLSKGGLYYYYKNTSEILIDIMDRGNVTFVETSTYFKALAKEEDYEAALEIMLSAIIEKFSVATDSRRLYLMFCAEVMYDSAIREAYDRLENDFFKKLSNMTKRDMCGDNEPLRLISRMVNILLMGQNLFEDKTLFINREETFRQFFKPLLRDALSKAKQLKDAETYSEMTAK